MVNAAGGGWLECQSSAHAQKHLISCASPLCPGLQVYCFTAMAKAVPQDTLRKLICVVLLQLISPDRSQVDTDNTFLKALNVLMMRVLANSQK